MAIEQATEKKIAVNKHDKKTMILRQEIGTGITSDGKDFDISYNISNGDPVIYVKGEGYYSVSLKEICERIMEARDAWLKVEVKP